MAVSGQEGRTMALKLFEKLFEWILFVLIFSVLVVFKWSAILVIGMVYAAWSLT